MWGSELAYTMIMTNMSLSIRQELRSDYEQIDALLGSAFQGKQEVVLVNQIRESQDYIPGLSFVAVDNNAIVGHLLFSKIQLTFDSGEACQILSLAPLSVLPQHQKQGVGSALVLHGLNEVRKSAYPLIVVVGHPQYYLKFDFVLAKPFGLRLKYEVPDNAFFVMEIEKGFLHQRSGLVEFPEYFDDAM